MWHMPLGVSGDTHCIGSTSSGGELFLEELSTLIARKKIQSGEIFLQQPRFTTVLIEAEFKGVVGGEEERPLDDDPCSEVLTPKI